MTLSFYRPAACVRRDFLWGSVRPNVLINVIGFLLPSRAASMNSGTERQTVEDIYKHPDAVVDQALDWFLRHQSDQELDAAQEVAFNHWLAAEPAHRRAWSEVNATWNAPETLVGTQMLDLNLRQKPAGRRGFRMRGPVRRYVVTGALAIAASLLLTLALPYLSGQITPALLADYATHTGEKREIALPDGSLMVLNTDTAIALDFDAVRRGVRLLRGEAWFDVVHDPAHPFHVLASHSEVEVKGTAFSVATENDRDTIRLQRGAVEAHHNLSDVDRVHLTAGQMVVASEKAMSKVTSFQPDESLAWLENRIVFDDTSLGEALHEIGRYFDGRLIVLNDALLNARVSGFYRTDRAADAIAAIVAASGGKVNRIPGNFIIIR